MSVRSLMAVFLAVATFSGNASAQAPSQSVLQDKVAQMLAGQASAGQEFKDLEAQLLQAEGVIDYGFYPGAVSPLKSGFTFNLPAETRYDCAMIITPDGPIPIPASRSRQVFSVSDHGGQKLISISDIEDGNSLVFQLLSDGEATSLLKFTSSWPGEEFSLEARPDGSLLDRQTGEVFPVNSMEHDLLQTLSHAFIVTNAFWFEEATQIAVGDPFYQDLDAVLIDIMELMAQEFAPGAKAKMLDSSYVVSGQVDTDRGPEALIQGFARAEITNSDVPDMVIALSSYQTFNLETSLPGSMLSKATVELDHIKMDVVQQQECRQAQ
ncbi:MAG: hypothetical protein ACPGOY_11940 [Rhodospirillaceae bacterium]